MPNEYVINLERWAKAAKADQQRLLDQIDSGSVRFFSGIGPDRVDTTDELRGQIVATIAEYARVAAMYGSRTQYPIIKPGAAAEVQLRGEALSQPIYWIGIQWAVTEHGVECREGTYAIEARRLWKQDDDYPWEQHLGEKTWVDLDDFCDALNFARPFFEARGDLKPRDVAKHIG